MSTTVIRCASRAGPQSPFGVRNGRRGTSITSTVDRRADVRCRPGRNVLQPACTNVMVGCAQCELGRPHSRAPWMRQRPRPLQLLPPMRRSRIWCPFSATPAQPEESTAGRSCAFGSRLITGAFGGATHVDRLPIRQARSPTGLTWWLGWLQQGLHISAPARPPEKARSCAGSTGTDLLRPSARCAPMAACRAATRTQQRPITKSPRSQ